MADTERALLIGAGGMLGEAMYAVCQDAFAEVRATDIDVNEEWLSYLDVRDVAALRGVFEEFRPTFVFNLAALTDLEYCEDHPDEAWETNALGAENVVLLANAYGATTVYISTAGIFAGEQEFFTDFDTPEPLSYYGKSKYHGECFTAERAEKFYVLRAGWMMGGGPKKDKKFINKLFQQLAAGSRTLHVVSDKLGTPTYTHDFAKNTLKVLNSGLYGVYNQVQKGSANRLEVATEFVAQLGLADQVTIEEVASDYFAKEYFAPRPYSEKLVNLKLKSRGLDDMRDWKEALAEYVKEFKPALE